MQLFSVFGTIGLKADEFNQGISEAESRGQGFGTTMGGVAGVVATAGAFIVGALVGIGAAATRVGGEFEASSRAIQAQTGFTTDEMARLEKGVRDLSLTQGSFSAREMMSSLENISIYGRDATEMLKLLEYGMVLADATGADLDTSLSLLSMSLDKAGKDVDSAGRYMNIFAQIARETNLPIQTIQDNVVALAPTMNGWNIELEQSAGWLARLKQEGIYGAAATSGLSYVFRDLATVTPLMAEELRGMGVELFDMHGNMNDGYVVLNQLKAVMGEMTDQELVQFQSELWGANGTTRAVLDALLNTADGAEEFTQRMFEAGQGTLEYGVAARMAADRQLDLAQAFGRGRNAGEDILKTIWEIIRAPLAGTVGHGADQMERLAIRMREGGDLHPHIQRLGEAIARLGTFIIDLVSAATPLATQILPVFATGLSLVLDGATMLYPAIIGLVVAMYAYKAAMAVQGLITGVTAATAGMTLAKYAATKAQIALNLAMKANPIGLVIAGIALLVGGLITLGRALNRETEAARELRLENERLIQSANSLSSSIENSAAAHGQRVRAMENEIATSRNLVERLTALGDAERHTVEQRARAVNYTRMLTDAMPELLRYLDEETGLLNLTTEAIERKIAATEEQMRVEVARERQMELLREQMELERQQLELRAQITRMEEEGAEVTVRTGRYTTEVRNENHQAIKELEAAYGSLTESIAGNASESEHWRDIVVESYTVVGEAVEEFTYAVDYGVQTIESRLADLATATNTELGEVKQLFDSAISTVINNFQLLNHEVSQSFAESASIFSQNAADTHDWADNVSAIMQEGMARGVDVGVLEKLQEMAMRGPGYAAEMAGDLERTFGELVPSLYAVMDAALALVAAQLGEDTRLVESAESIVENAAEAAYERATERFYEVGEAVPNSQAVGVYDNTDTFVDAVVDMQEAGIDAANDAIGRASPAKVYVEMGEAIPDSQALGVKNREPALLQKLGDLMQRAIDVFADWENKWHSIGLNGMESLAGGILSGKSAAINAAISVAQAAISAAKSALEMNSPSKPFWDMGENTVASYVGGVLAKIGDAEKAVDDVFGDLGRGSEWADGSSLPVAAGGYGLRPIQIILKDAIINGVDDDQGIRTVARKLGNLFDMESRRRE
ncbi:MAG: phage tail tape measure protein [Oscillospiraceae bacterium]|nr:phage tail tape measure protein [Oscillospiraceae bacterium]